MGWLNVNRMRLVIIGIVAAIALGGDHAKADFTFGEPVNLGPTVNSSSGDALDFVSYDGLEMYFDSRRSGGYGNWDIWVSRRETIDDDWGEPENLGPTINTSQGEVCANISADGLELYFSSYNRSGGYGDWDTYLTTRASRDDAWGEPLNLGLPVNSSNIDGCPFLTLDCLELYFYTQRSGGYGSDDIWVSRRATKDDPWGEPENLGPIVNSSASESTPFVSSDGLLLLFSEDYYGPIRPGGFGNLDMWMTRRSSISDPWGTPVNLGPIVNSSSLDGGPRISPDGSILYFCSERPGGYGGVWGDIYQSAIIPIVDFNGDKIVDAEDMCIMVDHWGEDYPLCDIGPMPWGDGVVDIEDLKVLAEHLFDDCRALAQWKLDEKAGDIASDSVGGRDGILYGEPIWQPTGGQVCGALELDGIDDYVETDFVLDPADGAFSVFAWIQGGIPGQVIISQIAGDGAGETWLGTDAIDGNLVTGLVPQKIGWVTPRPLVSESVVTDVQWHHVGLVWDGSYRALYVDGIEVAKDTAAQNPLKSATGGLHIGASKTLAEGTYFSGLIDDVRIYNKALTAEEISVLAQ